MTHISASSRFLGILLASSFALAAPAMANGRATARGAVDQRGGVRALAATTPKRQILSSQLLWATSWLAAPSKMGVIKLARTTEAVKTRGATALANAAFTGQVLPIQNGQAAIDVATLVFEPLTRGEHRVLLRMPTNETFEVLPARKSLGSSAEGARGAQYRELTKGWEGYVKLVEFFKTVRRGQPTRHFAAYGEEGLQRNDGGASIQTHIVDITNREVMSIPYNFLSVWNGSRYNNAYVLVEPLAADGTPRVGKVLGIPLYLLQLDFAGTLADPSKWRVMLDK